MNEHLIKLALEAGIIDYIDNETPRHHFVNANADIEELEKFAELIVKECLDTINRIKNDPLTNMGATQKMQSSTITAKDWMVAVVEDVEREIKKQFGVSDD